MRKFFTAALVAAATLCSFAAHAADKVRIGYWTSGVSLGYGAVLESGGFLAQRGIDAEFVHFPDVNAPLRALAAGAIGHAFAAGVCPVRIDVPDEEGDCRFAEVAGGVTANLMTQPQGSAAILWRAGGTGAGGGRLAGRGALPRIRRRRY